MEITSKPYLSLFTDDEKSEEEKIQDALDAYSSEVEVEKNRQKEYDAVLRVLLNKDKEGSPEIDDFSRTGRHCPAPRRGGGNGAGRDSGDEVIFTDVEGNEFRYAVVGLETLAGTAVEELEGGTWDLTLFTCTLGGQTRATVRCVLLESDET